MKFSAVGLLVVLLLSCTAFAADESGVLPATMDKYKKVVERVEALSKASAAKLAPEMVASAQQSITTAQGGLKSGNDKIMREYTDMAELQAMLAVALAEEKEAFSAVDNAKKQLAAHESRLSTIFSGKGDKQ